MKLNEKQIHQLELQGCRAQQWDLIDVSDDFNVDRVWRTHFSGACDLRACNKVYNSLGGVPDEAGIYDCRLHQVKVGRDCLLRKAEIANYELADEVQVVDVQSLVTTGPSRFGCGTRVAVVNEAGGREVVLHKGLTGQEAYLQVIYATSRPEAIRQLQQQIDATIEESTVGQIEADAQLHHCGTITNVNVGAHAVLCGVRSLTEGTIVSREDSRAFIGADVQMRDFVVLPGAEITEGALLERCFVGQNAQVGKQYSAVDTLAFANCQLFHGEACSLFAGPFTVSHHKGTLLIAAIFSFMNAGSSSNQSNHMYKMGPIHWGEAERGVKLASGSYLMWKAHVGAFTMVMGPHKQHPDTAEFPFSYLLGQDGKSYLQPGVNLRSVGTKRDIDKWAKRDGRKAPYWDTINYDWLSPVLVQQARKGRQILKELLDDKLKEPAAAIPYKGSILTHKAAHKGIELYDMYLSIAGGVGEEPWMDWMGQPVPVSYVEAVLTDLEAGKVVDVRERAEQAMENYEVWKAEWMSHSTIEGGEKALEHLELCWKRDGEMDVLSSN